jgi:ketosteroid isomerase-like protein
MTHPNETLFRQLLEAWGRGDREATAGFFSEDVVFSYPGPGPLHGDYRGRDELLRFWADQDRYSGGWFKPEFLDLVAGDRYIYLLVRLGAADEGRSWIRVVVYEVADGSIVAARVLEDDPVTSEGFFSRGA